MFAGRGDNIHAGETPLLHRGNWLCRNTRFSAATMAMASLAAESDLRDKNPLPAMTWGPVVKAGKGDVGDLVSRLFALSDWRLVCVWKTRTTRIVLVDAGGPWDLLNVDTDMLLGCILAPGSARPEHSPGQWRNSHPTRLLY